MPYKILRVFLVLTVSLLCSREHLELYLEIAAALVMVRYV